MNEAEKKAIWIEAFKIACVTTHGFEGYCLNVLAETAYKEFKDKTWQEALAEIE